MIEDEAAVAAAVTNIATTNTATIATDLPTITAVVATAMVADMAVIVADMGEIDDATVPASGTKEVRLIIRDLPPIDDDSIHHRVMDHLGMHQPTPMA